MSYYKYDFESLWFQIFQKVLRLNESLGHDALDKSQLREVTTSIFIAQTQRGVVRPMMINDFENALVRLVMGIKERKSQEKIYKSLSEVVREIKNNGKGEKVHGTV